MTHRAPKASMVSPDRLDSSMSRHICGRRGGVPTTQKHVWHTLWCR